MEVEYVRVVAVTKLALALRAVKKALFTVCNLLSLDTWLKLLCGLGGIGFSTLLVGFLVPSKIVLLVALCLLSPLMILGALLFVALIPLAIWEQEKAPTALPLNPDIPERR